LFLRHYAPHDRDQPSGTDPGDILAVIDGVTSVLAAEGTRVHDTPLRTWKPIPVPARAYGNTAYE
jgi:hypothetical protein